VDVTVGEGGEARLIFSRPTGIYPSEDCSLDDTARILESPWQSHFMFNAASSGEDLAA
jgi:hypothetical protein